MKFSRYLEDTQTPEWKRAYIDYRKIKRCIREISDGLLEDSGAHRSSRYSARPGHTPSIAPLAVPSAAVSRAPASKRPLSSFWDTDVTSPPSVYSSFGAPQDAWLSESRILISPCGSDKHPLAQRKPAPPIPELHTPEQDVSERPGSILPDKKRRADDRHTFGPLQFETLSVRTITPKLIHRASSATIFEPLSPMLELPPPMQNAVERKPPQQNWETDGLGTPMRRPSAQTGTHFRENARRRHRESVLTSTSLRSVYSLDGLHCALSPLELRFFDILDDELDKVENFYLERSEELDTFSSLLNDQLRELEVHRKIYYKVQDIPVAPSRPFVEDVLANMHKTTVEHIKSDGDDSSSRQQFAGTPPALDPSLYQQNKRKLKKAIREHYFGIELLNNYRVLNLTAFRKALKSFEKVTQIPVHQPYMTEKVDNCAFASDAKMLELISNAESLYAVHFANGNKRAARETLRSAAQKNTHHTLSFRSGLYIGLGIAALTLALILSSQEGTRHAVPARDVLLQVYGGFLLPVLLALLIGVNMFVWKQHRINYVFIFELDVRAAIDPHQYVEIPSLLFLTLSIAALLSFSAVGRFAATTWPLAWLGFAILFLLNPLPVLARSSRYWFVRKFAMLFASGAVHVRFSHFWLGDQFCSLAFSLASLWTLGCSIHNDWGHDSSHKCGPAHYWQVPLVLSCVPSCIRFLQCVKRYTDSGLGVHMINGGKYLSSVLYYIFYYLWRHNGAKIGDKYFLLFCLGGSFMSFYTSVWDMLVDWSFLHPAVEYKFLHPELLYRDNILGYYFAIVFNTLVRWSWISYFLVPSGLDITPRTFIVACLEILRRAHWNIYRLESEQLGNMDQYRATREVPLPYTLEQEADDDQLGRSAFAELDNCSIGQLTSKLPSVRLPRMYGKHTRDELV